MSFQTFEYDQPFELESGAILPGITIGYHMYGQPTLDQDNVVWVCHALTANSDPLEWWPGLFGTNDLFNPNEHLIICANILGSCYGSTNPLSTDKSTGEPYYHRFPELTVRDLVKAHRLLAEHLGIQRIELLIGGSLGGQQALEWAIEKPHFIRNLAVIAANAWHSPWGIAFNESQRMAIETDQTWQQRTPDAGREGLRTARSIALISYRGYQTYRLKQEEEHNDKTDAFNAATYQQYQGSKLARRFNAFSYWYLSKAMDTHNVARNREGVSEALSRISARTVVVGIQSDLLFPIQEQSHLARHIPGAEVVTIDSVYGHDGFLLETRQLTEIFESRFDFLTHKSLKMQQAR